MTPIADMVRKLFEKGVDRDAILIAIEAAEQAIMLARQVENPVEKADAAAEKRRAWDRDRKRQKRVNSTGIPPDIHPTPPDSANEAISLSVVSKESKEVVKKEKKRGCKLPPDWTPKLEHYDEGAKRGLTANRVDEIADNMRNWCAANANRSVTTKADWDATFMGFIRREPANGQRSGSIHAHPGAQQSGSAAVFAGVAAAAERRARERHAAGQQREVSGNTDPATGDDPDFFRADGSTAAHR